MRVEARSPDGLVEAVSVINHPFALGVQWHPEWNGSEYALSRILSRALSPLVSTISLKNSDSDHYSLRKCKYE
ncbi:gamma-glutamyl-gamma-aminobutyrate hydrolase family protein [Escherichia coli]